MGRSRDDLIRQAEFFIINRRSFIGESNVSQEEMDRFLDTISFSFESFQKLIGQDRPVDPRFDLIPFRSRPLFQTTDGNFACVDVAFLLEKMHSGAHWVLHDKMESSGRDDLFRGWGILFEHYISWLFRGASRLPARFSAFPRWKAGSGPFDTIEYSGREWSTYLGRVFLHETKRDRRSSPAGASLPLPRPLCPFRPGRDSPFQGGFQKPGQLEACLFFKDQKTYDLLHRVR